MPKRSKIALLLSLLISFSLECQAEEIVFTSRETIHRSSMLLGGSLVQLQTPTAALTGFGGLIAYRYSLNSVWALRPQIGQVYETMGGGKSLFTSLGGLVEYAITGAYLWGETQYESRGESVAKLFQPRTTIWSTGFGFEQLFLSGSESVYAAPGFTAQVGYHFNYSARSYGVELKFGQYSSGEKPFTGITLNVLSSFDL